MKHTKKRALMQRQAIQKKATQNNILSTPNNLLKYLVEIATLAPSTHNTQPWRVSLNSNKITVLADLTKQIPQADPTGRDMFISLGAFIKNIELAAAALNMKAGVHFLAKFNKKAEKTCPVAEVTITNIDNAKLVNSPLLNSIIYRQNFRGFFTALEASESKAANKILSSNSVQSIKNFIYSNKTEVEELANLTAKAIVSAYKNPDFRREISAHINHNFSIKSHGLHGYSLRLNTPMSFVVPKVIKSKDVGSKLAALNYKSFMTSSGVVVMCSPDSQRDWLEIGRRMQEIFVELAQAGLATSVYVASIEIADHRLSLQNIVNPPKNLMPQMLFCYGKAEKPLGYSPRKPVSDILE